MLIGIPVGVSKTQYFVNQAYVDYVHEAGFEPVMISPRNNILEMSAFCDGLLLAGGIDIDPIFYGESNYSSQGTDPVKDDFERQVFYAFVKLHKPVFGICRGLQLIAREYLHNVPKAKARLEFVQHIGHHNLANELGITRTIPAHSVFADRNILYGEAHKIYQKMFVNSMHHQCLMIHPPLAAKKKGYPLISYHLKALAVSRYGMSEKDKGDIVEALDLTGWYPGKITAVQWHPEELKDLKLIQKFFDVAEAGVEVVEGGIAESEG
jgi:gamma-glutamyl-gamma-aminobutyrate hydrolase PuuD